jgi:4-diphosphocytidyl-2-C-methyl-D-erythritol kinase
MQSIDLYDELYLDVRCDTVSMETNAHGLPCDARNLCIKAAEALRKATGCGKGVHIRLRKNVPVAAGLGGGSSDAAGVLLGLNRLWELRCSSGELKTVAATIGSDVPFFIDGGTALCTGRGECVERVEGVRGLPYVLLVPSLPVSTPEVYDAQRREEGVHSPCSVEEFIRFMREGDLSRIGACLYNALENNDLPYMKTVRAFKRLLREHGALGTLMSGSGGSVFGIARDGEAAEKIAGEIRGIVEEEVFVCCGVTAATVTVS